MIELVKINNIKFIKYIYKIKNFYFLLKILLL